MRDRRGGRGGRKTVGLLLASLLGLTLAFASVPAANATVRIGLPGFLPTGDSAGCAPAPCAQSLSTVPGGHAVSPVNGTIKSWGAGTNTNGGAAMVSLRLRVINPLASPIGFLRSSAVESRPSSGEHIIASSIPIGIGERVALEILTAMHAAQALSSPGYTVQYWQPVPSDGSGAPPTTFPDSLVELFADVEPSNSIPEPTIKRNKKKGTAQLTVDLPNGGELLASSPSGQSSAGAAAAKKKPPLIKPASATATGPGAVTLTLRPTKKTKKRLRSEGKAKGSVSLSFTPTFGTAGTKTLTVKLKRNP